MGSSSNDLHCLFQLTIASSHSRQVQGHPREWGDRNFRFLEEFGGRFGSWRKGREDRVRGRVSLVAFCYDQGKILLVSFLDWRLGGFVRVLISPTKEQHLWYIKNEFVMQ